MKEDEIDSEVGSRTPSKEDVHDDKSRTVGCMMLLGGGMKMFTIQMLSPKEMKGKDVERCNHFGLPSF